MALKLTYDYQLSVDVIHHAAVIAHLQDVLNTFANKPEYHEFYIGITNDLERRRKEHAVSKPQYKMMCAIYQEQTIVVGNSFHNLERDAINTFRQGIKHPQTGQRLLQCGNTPGGSQAKNWLYILVG